MGSGHKDDGTVRLWWEVVRWMMELPGSNPHDDGTHVELRSGHDDYGTVRLCCIVDPRMMKLSARCE